MIRRSDALRLLGAGMIALAVAPWLAAPPAAAGDKGGGPADGHKVTICHRTNSDTNPYVVITVDTDAAGGGKDQGAGDHAAEHKGPIWNATLKDQHIEWGDIIPPYTDDQGVHFPGYNWSAEGQATYAHGCTPTRPHTSSAPVTTSSSAPVTTSSSAPVTTSSSAPVTRSSSAPVTTHTSSAPATVIGTSASSAPASRASTVAATSTSAAASSGSVSVLPTKIGTSSAAGGVAPAAPPLAPTGQGSSRWAMIAVSVGLFLAGAALVLLPGRLAAERRRRH